MRSHKRAWGAAPLLALTLVLVYVAGAEAEKKAREVTVQVLETAVRQAPSFVAPVVARLGYTVRLQVVEETGEWVRVEVPGHDAAGWVHASALTEKQIVLRAPDKKTAKRLAAKKETSLAGRSFQDEVEKRYRSKNPKLEEGYAALARLLATAPIPNPEELAQFRRDGDLAPLQGATP